MSNAGEDCQGNPCLSVCLSVWGRNPPPRPQWEALDGTPTDGDRVGVGSRGEASAKGRAPSPLSPPTPALRVSRAPQGPCRVDF